MTSKWLAGGRTRLKIKVVDVATIPALSSILGFSTSFQGEHVENQLL
jgi:hypothetical protein